MNTDMHIDSDSIRGHIETIILSFLTDKDCYGYEIGSLVYERSGGKYEIKEPTLYSAIRRLEAQKLISGYWGDESQGGRRKYYTITAEGRRILEERKCEWLYSKKIIDTLLQLGEELHDNQRIVPFVDQTIR